MSDFSITFIAQVLGPVLAIAALGLLGNQARLKKIINQVVDNDALQYMAHAMRLFLGFFIFTAIIDTGDAVNLGFKLAGAVVAVIGALGVVFPSQVHAMFKRSSSDLSVTNTVLVLKLLVGLGLIYVGYFM